jgi:quercetin dioxygenase-like cupin family protein
MKAVNIIDIIETGVSHNPEIRKKVIIERGEIPQLMTFGQATFKPGQSVETHAHETMYEVFYILSGKASFIIEGEEIIATEGTTVVIDAKEMHSQSNPYSEDVVWVYFGIAVD